MRHLFLILLIALLPLRGWVSDAMATTMVIQQVQKQHSIATKTIANNADKIDSKAHFNTEIAVKQAPQTSADCASHVVGTEQLHAADTHCESCSACQACHTVALSPAAVNATAVLNLGTVPPVFIAQFASAEAALGQKPPIS